MYLPSYPDWEVLRTDGATGATGATGPAGPKGDPGEFTGTLQSPNGSYSLSLTDTGAELKGPGGTVKSGSASIDVVGISGSVRLTPAGTAIQGSVLTLNGCNKPVARIGDSITGTANGTVASGTTYGYFAADVLRRPVMVWEGIYVPLGPGPETPVPVITSFEDWFVPGINATVTVSIPTSPVASSVAGTISAGAPTVCTG